MEQHTIFNRKPEYLDKWHRVPESIRAEAMIGRFHA